MSAQMEDDRKIRFDATRFDPNLPVNMRLDYSDFSENMDKNSMGVLASPTPVPATVTVNLGEYQMTCHSRPLAMQSNYFRRHLTRFPSPREVHVPKTIPIEGLDAALRFMETSRGIDVTFWNAGPILSAASRLEMPILQRRMEQYIRAVSKLDDTSFLQCWNICRCAPAGVQMREEMLAEAASRFGRLPKQSNWPTLNSHLVRKLLLRPELKSVPPVAVFEAALVWIAGNPNAEPSDVDRVLSVVPFDRMDPIDRMSSLVKADEMKLALVVQPRVVQSNWQQTSAGAERPEQKRSPTRDSKRDKPPVRAPLPSKWNKSSSDKPRTSGEEKSAADTPPSSKRGKSSRGRKREKTPPASKREKVPAENPSDTKQKGKPSSRPRKPIQKAIPPGVPMEIEPPPETTYVDGGQPYRFSCITVATKMRPDQQPCSYQEEIVMKPE